MRPSQQMDASKSEERAPDYKNVCVRIVDNTIVWAVLSIASLLGSGYLSYLHALIYLDLPPTREQYETRLVPGIGAPIFLFFFGAISSLLFMKFIVLLINPTKAKNLPRLTDLEQGDFKTSTEAEAESERFKQKFKEESARGQSESDAKFETLFSSIKKKVTTEGRFNVLEDSLPSIKSFSKEEINKILTLFPLQEDALRIFDLLEPYMLTEEETRQRELANQGPSRESMKLLSLDSSAALPAATEIEQQPAPRRSKWMERNIQPPGNEDKL